MSLFNDKRNNNVVEDIEFVEIADVDRNVIRQARFRILNTLIIYNEEEDFIIHWHHVLTRIKK